MQAPTDKEINALEKFDAENIICGIYMLFFEGQIVYIGQSINIFSRVSRHTQEGKKRFDKFSFFKCERQFLDGIESELIHRYSPKYNSTIIPGGGYFSLKQWGDKIGLSQHTIRQTIEETGFLNRKKWYNEQEMQPFLKYFETMVQPRIKHLSRRRPYINIDYDEFNSFLKSSTL